jgi:DNA-binding transcriptional ArsR family regulator
MANGMRLRILEIISQGEMPVGLLAEAIGLSQSALSQHLGKLRAAHLVDTRRDAQTIYYSCSSPAVARLLATLRETSGPSPPRLLVENDASRQTGKKQAIASQPKG